MSKQIEKTSELKKKNSIWRRYKVAAILILLCLVSVYIYVVMAWKCESQKLSEKVIREAAAAQLNKDPNQLQKKDFANITELDLTFVTYPNISLLSNFINLQHLHISRDYPNDHPWAPQNTSKFMVLLEKLGIENVSHTKYIDLYPLKYLSKLETLNIKVPVKNLKPLAYLANLKELTFSGGFILIDSQGNFCNKREILDVEPLAKSSNLQKLSLAAYLIKNIETLAKLKNLRELRLIRQITYEEKEYLRKALPDLKIIDYTGGSVTHYDESLLEILLMPKNETK